MSSMLMPAFTWLDAAMFLVTVGIYAALFVIGPDRGPKQLGTVHPIGGTQTQKDASQPSRRAA